MGCGSSSPRTPRITVGTSLLQPMNFTQKPLQSITASNSAADDAPVSNPLPALTIPSSIQPHRYSAPETPTESEVASPPVVPTTFASSFMVLQTRRGTLAGPSCSISPLRLRRLSATEDAGDPNASDRRLSLNLTVSVGSPPRH
eukprot:NODE_5417_length_948_cov_71.695758_g5199_i0.p1 GENE.NODE_5417_length_948_cov_71.695758_g5199_i0~~NODE_5417_length_948_cov_71.695758_g5199_i0.p1  ORF type:complete len:144 (+),score=13.32 NODE_5417_length_948_cov_71.695758_g5199_i0:51-482(+)